MADAALPSPKRVRIEESGVQEEKDDLDDIYNEAPTQMTNPLTDQSALSAIVPPEVPTVFSGAIEISQLPGLGLEAEDKDEPKVPITSAPEQDPLMETEMPIAEITAKVIPEIVTSEESKAAQTLMPDSSVLVALTDHAPFHEVTNDNVTSVPPDGIVQAPLIPTETSLETLPGIEFPATPHTSNGACDIASNGVGGDDRDVVLPRLLEAADADKPAGDPEFELDSSPLVSASDSSDLSSSSEEDGADDYKLLDPEEQARRLMAEDGGSDDERTGGKPSGPLRTMNEKPDEIVEKPDIVVTPDMEIVQLGLVENTIDNIILVKAKTTGEYQVLDFGSPLCMDNREVIGAVAETLGRVQQPFYSVHFTNAAAIADAGIKIGTPVSYVVKHAKYIFTQPLQGLKGSDASNIHDEEVGDDELEFSDDEAEAEHRRRVKQQRQARRGGREGGDGFSRGPRGGRGNSSRGNGPRLRGGSRMPEGQSSIRETSPNAETNLDYDDRKDTDGPSNDEDPGNELYTPLTRPSNLHEMTAPPLRNPEPVARLARHASHQAKGRGRGDRGRGPRRDFNASTRGGHQNYRSPQPQQQHPLPPVPPQPASTSSGPYPLPQQALPPNPSPSLPQVIRHNQYGWQDGNAAAAGRYQQEYSNNAASQYTYPPYDAQSSSQNLPNYPQPQQPQHHQQQIPQHYPQYNAHQPYPPQPGTNGLPMPIPGQIPPGAHVNPAFFQRQSQVSPSGQFQSGQAQGQGQGQGQGPSQTWW